MRYTEYHEGIAVIKDELWHKDAIRQLAQWEDLEEMGRLLPLPCTPGEKIYALTSAGVVERKVITIIITSKKMQIVAENKRGDVDLYNVLEFGKTIFSSKETALYIWSALQQLERWDDK